MTLLLSLASAPGGGQQADTQRRVQEIRTWYGETQGALDALQASDREYTTAGGEGHLTLYRDDTAPRKLVVQFDGDGLSWTREYFFRDGVLFFVFEHSETFPIWPDQPPEQFGVTEQRHYFADGNMIRWLVNDHREDMRQRAVSVGDERWESTEAALVEDAATWLAFAASDQTDFDTFLEHRP